MMVTVIGAGLAGSEAAWQLAERGFAVRLCEMKPSKMSPAHHSPDFAELVCSNSLRGDRLENAVGLLKEELRRLGSLILSCAEANRVEAGGALAVDRYGFSGLVTQKIRNHPNITVVEEEITQVPEGPVIIATGPLTSDAMSAAIQAYFGGQKYMSFFDAAAPLITFDSIDMSKAWFASRYDRGDADYVNCAMEKDEYIAFVEALKTAEEAPVHGFEDKHVFEGCMPVEVMARRGEDTLRYGPMKPVGLKDPKTGKEPYAVVQLRKDNALGSVYNLVGFQTHLKFPEQKRVFSMIPALHDAEFVRYDGRRGLCGIHCVRLSGSCQHGCKTGWSTDSGFPEGNCHRRVVSVHQRYQHRQFPADECQFRHHDAAWLQGQGQSKQEPGNCRALACHH